MLWLEEKLVFCVCRRLSGLVKNVWVINFGILVEMEIVMGVGVIIDKQLLEDVVKVRRKGDRILLVKIILGREIFNIISVYAL